jgi:hypothetical protein
MSILFVVLMFVRTLGWLVYERRGEPRAGDHERMEGSIVYALRLCLVFSSHCRWVGILQVCQVHWERQPYRETVVDRLLTYIHLYSQSRRGTLSNICSRHSDKDEKLSRACTHACVVFGADPTILLSIHRVDENGVYPEERHFNATEGRRVSDRSWSRSLFLTLSAAIVSLPRNRYLVRSQS